jgi:hypothetical protein
MKTSNLALRLEEFAALETEMQRAESMSLQVFGIVGRDDTRNARRRLTFGDYRIQIRDSGLRPFRVF